MMPKGVCQVSYGWAATCHFWHVKSGVKIYTAVWKQQQQQKTLRQKSKVHWIQNRYQEIKILR